jgi:site-specific recombinase XerD
MLEKNQIKTISSGLSIADEEFKRLADVPPEFEWFANIDNAQTRRAYQNDLKSFMQLFSITRPEQFREVTRSHVLKWRAHLEQQNLAGSTIQRKLAALGSLFNYLCDRNAVVTNPVNGVKRPPVETYEGVTPTFAIEDIKKLLNAPDPSTLKGKRDRAILSLLAYHAPRRAEVCSLLVKDVRQKRQGVPNILIHGKGGKIRYLPAYKGTLQLIDKYLAAAGHAGDSNGPLFRSVSVKSLKEVGKALTPGSIYTHIVKLYMEKQGISAEGGNYGPHALRASAATYALKQKKDLSEVQEWLGHKHISTTRIYDRRKNKGDSKATVLVKY